MVLKTLEGSARFLIDTVLKAMTSTEEGRTATQALLPLLRRVVRHDLVAVAFLRGDLRGQQRKQFGL